MGSRDPHARVAARAAAMAARAGRGLQDIGGGCRGGHGQSRRAGDLERHVAVGPDAHDHEPLRDAGERDEGEEQNAAAAMAPAHGNVDVMGRGPDCQYLLSSRSSTPRSPQ
jgi:hypothetical protein